MVKLKVEKLHNQTQWILSKFVLNYSQLVMIVSQWGLVHTEITSKYEIRNNWPLNKHLMYEKRNANLRMLFTATAWTKPGLQFQGLQVSCDTSWCKPEWRGAQDVLVPEGNRGGEREGGSEMELTPANYGMSGENTAKDKTSLHHILINQKIQNCGIMEWAGLEGP